MPVEPTRKGTQHLVESDLTFTSEEAAIPATLCVPDSKPPYPGVLIVGGSLSSDRNGACVDEERPWIPPRDALRRLAHRLSDEGFASLRYDWRRQATAVQVTRDLLAAYATMTAVDCVDTSRTCVLGESAGAYYTCLAAREGMRPTCYALLGALYSPMEVLFAFNFERVRRYAHSSPERLEWVKRFAARELAIGLFLDQIMAAAREGRPHTPITVNGLEFDYALPQLGFELSHPPATLFRHLRAPVLILHGAHDMNVPVDDAYAIQAALLASGNADVELHIIENADHSFQHSAASHEERVRERISLESFRRPYVEEAYHVLVAFLKTYIPLGKGEDA